MKFRHDFLQTRLPLGPMIDAVFLLLCFFLVTIRFTSEKFIESPLPTGDDKRIQPDDQPIRIQINRTPTGPRFFFNNILMTDLSELLTCLDDYCQTTNQPAVAIDPQSDVLFQSVVDVVSACQEVEIPSIHLSSGTRLKKETKP